MHTMPLSPKRSRWHRFRLQTYEHTDLNGVTRVWNVTAGNRIASDGRAPVMLNLAEIGLTTETIKRYYRGIDEDHAMTTNLSEPLLLVPLSDAVLIIDGWHRLWKAAVSGIPEMPALMLSQLEADSIRIE